MKYLSILIFLLPIPLLAQQVQVQSPVAGQQDDLVRLYDLTLNNSGGASDCFIEVEVYTAKNKRVYQAQSRVISLPRGVLVLNQAQWEPMSSAFGSADLKSPSPGDYRVEYKLYRPGDFKILGRLTEQLKIVKPEKKAATEPAPPPAPKPENKPPVAQANSEKKKETPPAAPPKEEKKAKEKPAPPPPAPKEEKKAGFKLPVQFSGEGRLTGHFSTRQGTYSEVPQQYGRAELFPKLTIAEVPIGAAIQLSTEQRSHREPMNAFAFRFDESEFQQNMRRKLSEKMADMANSANPLDQEQALAFKDNLLKKQFPKMDEWKKQLDDPDLQAKLKEVKELDNLEQVLQNEAFEKSARELGQLEGQLGIDSEANLELQRSRLTPQQYQQMKEGYAMREQFKQLSERKSALEAKAKDLKKYQKIADKLKAAEKADARSLLNNPKDLKAGLKQFGMNKGLAGVMSSVQNFGVGTSFPFYTSQTFSGLSVNGIHAELNPGGFLYLAGTYGKSARQTLDTTGVSPRYTFDQRLLGLRAGVGSPQASHLIATYIRMEDRGDSAYINQAENITKPPAENYVLGLDGQISLFGGDFQLGGEVNGSIFNRDKNSTTTLGDPLGDSNFPLKSFFEKRTNTTSAIDIAYRGNLQINLFEGATRLRGNVSRVGPGYRSAARILLNDLLRYRMELSQSLLGKKAQFQLYASRDRNQTTPHSNYFRSEVKSFGATFRLQIPNIPYVMLTYAPYQQNNDNSANGQSYQNESTMLNIITGHNFSVGGSLFVFSQAGYIRQQFSTPLPDGDYATSIFMLTQSVSTGGGLTFSFNGTYQPKLQIGTNTTRVLTTDLSGTFSLFKKWQNSIGVQFLEQDPVDQRFGMYYRASYQLNSIVNLQANLQRNNYNDDLDLNGYDEWVGWLMIGLRW